SGWSSAAASPRRSIGAGINATPATFGFEDLHADIARVEATLPSTTAKTPDRGASDSLPAHLSRKDMRLDLEHQAYPCCGGELHVIGETVSEMFAIDAIDPFPTLDGPPSIDCLL